MRTLLLAALLAAGPASASEPPPPPPPGSDDPTDMAMGEFDAIAAKLGLTQEQTAKVRELVYQANQQRVDLRARVQKAEMELKHHLAADALDEKAALNAVDTLNAAEADLRRSRVLLVVQIRKVVTPEQWKKLLDLRRDRARERRGERPPDGE